MIDVFTSDGVVTSIKSIDLCAATYQNTATLSRTLNGYVDSVAAFNGKAWGSVTIDASQVTSRQLLLVVPKTPCVAQQEAINAVAARAQKLGVKVIVIPYP